MNPRQTNWDRFRDVYERRLDNNPDERAMYDAAKAHYKAEARRLGGDDGEGDRVPA